MISSLIFLAALLMGDNFAISQAFVPYGTKQESVPLSEYVRKVFQDAKGHYWFGTNNDGVARFDGQSLRFFTPTEGLAGFAIRGIVQDRNGAIWFATDGGVSRYRDGEFKNYTTAHGLTDNDVWSIGLDAKGRIWAGTKGGVCRLVDDVFVPFDLPESKVKNPNTRFSPKLVWCMLADRAGNLWFGTDGAGVYRFDGRHVVSFTESEGLAGNQVLCMVEDHQGVLWFGFGEGGISSYDGSRFQSPKVQGESPKGSVWTIHSLGNEGMMISVLGEGLFRFDGRSFSHIEEDLPRHVQSIYRDQDGVLWFGCSGGLFRSSVSGTLHVSKDGPWSDGHSSATEPASPLHHFSRLTAHTWKTTVLSGRSMLHAWRWGPGQRSIEHWTKGEDAGGKPWQQLVVYYWDPLAKKIRFLGISPFASGISRGDFEFDGTDAFTEFVLTQTIGRREMQIKWHFLNSDNYREKLLERTAPGEIVELVEFNYVKTTESLDEGLEVFDDLPKLTPELEELQFLVGKQWSAKSNATQLRASIGWVSLANFLYGKIYRVPDSRQPNSRDVSGTSSNAEPWGSVFIYHDVGYKAKRFLVLTEDGNIYDGEIKKLDDASWSFVFSDDSSMTSRSMKAQLQSLKDQRWSFRVHDDGAGAEPNRGLEVIFNRDDSAE